MNRIYTTTLFIALLFVSCSKDKAKTSDPVLNKIIGNSSCSCEPYIDQWEWRGKAVYSLAYWGTCDWKLTFYDENGGRISFDGNAAYEAFLNELKFKDTVWRCK